VQLKKIAWVHQKINPGRIKKSITVNIAGRSCLVITNGTYSDAHVQEKHEKRENQRDPVKLVFYLLIFREKKRGEDSHARGDRDQKREKGKSYGAARKPGKSRAP